MSKIGARVTKKKKWKIGDRVTGQGWLSGKVYTGTVESFCEGAPAVRVDPVCLVYLSPETITAAE